MSKQITLRLPIELHEQIKREAERKGIPVQDLLTIILWDFETDNVVPE